MRPNVLSCALIFDASIPEPNSGCWLWLRGVNDQGYGKIKIGGKIVLAHRASFAAFKSSPARMLVCHKCDVPLCVNPEHLFLGTHAVNHADRNSKLRQARGDRQGLRLHPDRAPRGERNGSAKLSAEQVIDILSSASAGAALARAYGVSRGLIYSIRKGRIWKHLKGESNG